MRRNLLLILTMPLLAAGCGMGHVRAIDDATGFGIQGATVEITDTNDATRVVGTTDWQGDLLFAAPKNLKSVTIRHDGYQPYTGPMVYNPYEEVSVEARLVPLGGEATGFDRLKDFKGLPDDFGK